MFVAEFVIHGIVNGQEISKSSESARVFCESFYVNGKGLEQILKQNHGVLKYQPLLPVQQKSYNH